MHSLIFVPFFSLKTTTAIEKKFIKKKGNSYLIKSAGKAVFNSVTKLNQNKLKRIKIFVGPGNNGSDGLFLASFLIRKKYKVDIHLFQKSKLNHQKIINELDLVNYIVPEKDISCSHCTLIIDALFGTGLNRIIKSNFSKIIDEINSSKKYVVSIDIPSGLNSETGECLNKAVNSNLTCTLISLKKGLFTKKGRDFWDSIDNYPLINEKINTNNYLFSLTKLVNYKIYSSSKKILSSKNISFGKSFDTHKNSFGKSLIIGGGNNFFGALLIAGQSSLKTGTRYVELITTKKHAELLPLNQPEFITSSYNDATFYEKLNNYNNLLFGPGLGQSKWSKDIFSKLCNFLQKKNNLRNIIFDADALNLLSEKPFKNDKWILTPHPGEAAKLLGTNTKNIQEDRFTAIVELQKKYGGIIVLKGSGTLIQTPKNNTYICLHGNEGMATAGMGDCLGGIILSTTNLVKDKVDAVLFGTGIHSLAADQLEKNKGTIGILATDVIEKCSSLLNLKS